MQNASARAITLFSAAVAGVIAVLPPIGYFTLTYLREKGEMTAEVELYAQMVTGQVISRNPEMWRFEFERLENLIRPEMTPSDLPEQRRLLDADNSVVARSDEILVPPVLTVSGQVWDSGRAVGHVEVGRSLAPVLIDTALVALFGIALGMAVYLVPVRALRSAYARLEHQATHDRLTGLPNRELFEDRLRQATAEARRNSTRLAVAFLDLDNFKSMNDKLGHAVGDAILQGVAERLMAALREGDTVGRQGGDEFVLILGGHKNVEAISRVTQRILGSFATPLSVGEHTLRVTCSIGVSIFPDDGDDLEMLLKNADAAMYLAKERGRNNCQFYSSQINAGMETRRILETELRQALETGELLLHFQPQVHLGSGAIVGAEALLRWRHPRRGLLAPADFLAVAEERGMLPDLDRWVVRAACGQNRAWQDAGLPPIRVAVNVSSAIRDKHFVRTITDTLRESGLSPEFLDIEVTEAALTADRERSMRVLGALRKLGVQISADHFGTAACSLSFLKELPVDRLKVDRSFVRNIGLQRDDEGIVQGVVSLGYGLGLAVLAHGVETVEQLAFVRNRGCDEAQGYYFSRAVPAEAFAVLLREGLPAVVTE
jgi:diguanylate cyclase (GGDEF)-like protein